MGFLTSLVYVFVFLFAKIYADMGLQTYYVGISVYGFYQWTRKKHETHTENDSLPSDRILYTSEPSAFRGDYRNIWPLYSPSYGISFINSRTLPSP